MAEKQQQQVPSHIQRRQARELEEQRILGLAPLAVDAITGSTISPHVPTMLSTAPWYRKDLQTGGNGAAESTLTIAHHLEGSDLLGAKDVVLPDAPVSAYERVEVPVVSANAPSLLPKHATGACKNCGATTHKAENCLRPKRKVGSVYTGSNEGAGLVSKVSLTKPSPAASVLLAPVKASFEQKKDAWSRSTAKNYQDTWDSFEKRKRERDEKEKESLASLAKAGPRAEGASLFDARTAADGLKVANHDLSSLPKYLENLDDDTFYDPRTKSMRGNPNALKKADPSAATSVYKGDNAVLHTGGYYDYLDQQARYLSGESKSFVEISGSASERESAIATKSEALADRLLMLQGGAGAGTVTSILPESSSIMDALYDAPVEREPLPAIPAFAVDSGGLGDGKGSDEDEYSPL